MAAKFLPYLLAGISVGGQYALIAIGYTMVYGILRLINFAHGDIFTVAGFLMVYATASLPLTISIPLVVVATVLLGIAVEKIAYKPLRTAPRMSVMISAIGMSYLLQNSMWYVTGGLAKQYPALPGSATLSRCWLPDQAGHGRDAVPRYCAGGCACHPDPENQDRHGNARSFPRF
mgnify:CR=1 FL=1